MTMGTRFADGDPHVLEIWCNVREEGSRLAIVCLLVVASAALNGTALIVDNIELNELGETVVEITVFHVMKTFNECDGQVCNCVTHASLSRSCCNLHSTRQRFSCTVAFRTLPV